MNWKQLGSMAAAAAAAAIVTVAQNHFFPSEPVEWRASIAGVVAAIVHKINIWGGIPETTVKS